MGSGRGVALSGVVCFGTITAALAQAVPPSSDPGRIPQRFERPPQPKALPRTGGITLPSTVPPDDAARMTLTVARFEIVGATVYEPRDFAGLTDALTGRPIPLAEVYALAARITARYGAAGYVLSRAVVPPQSFDFDGAVVRIEIIEGTIDEVVWPASLGRYRDFFSAYAARIVASRPANIQVIERYLLLAGDLPGLSFTTTFQPSTTQPKASTLIVTAREKPVDLEASVDNRGSEGRGPWQARAAGTANNWLGLHESLSINAATAVPSTEQLRFAGATWRQVLSSEGLTFLFGGTYNSGIPGLRQLRDLDYDSTGRQFNAQLAYPIVRSRDENLSLAGIAFTADVKSDAGGEPLTEDRVRGVRARLDYDRADALGGINFLQLTASHGIDGLGSTGNDNRLASRRGGTVDFTKFEALASRAQALPFLQGLSLYGAVYGQYAWDPLLVVEQCGYGGKTFGRAFDASGITGDNCLTSLVELRYDLALLDNIFSRKQVYGFADHGLAERKIFSAGVPEHEWGSSAGAGLRLGWRDNVSASVEAAKGIGGELDNEWRGHAELTVRY